MVLAERNTESIRNGRRGPSPNGNNGNCSPTSSSDEENCKFFSFKNDFLNNLKRKQKYQQKKITASKKIGSKSSKTKSSEYEGETHFSL